MIFSLRGSALFAFTFALGLAATGCVDEDEVAVNDASCAAREEAPEQARTNRPAADGYLTFEGYGTAFDQFKVTREGISNQELVLHRGDDGRTFVGAVWAAGGRSTTRLELHAMGDRVRGERGAQPIDLRLEKRGGETEVSGNYGGSFARITLRKELDRYCAFHDDAKPDDEAATCANMKYAIQIPKPMSDLPEAEQAAMLLVAFYR